MKKRIIALGLIVLMSLSVVVGCGKKEDSKKGDVETDTNEVLGEDLAYDETVLKVGEHEVSLRSAYFLMKFWQSNWQPTYASILGDEWYNEYYDEDSTMQDYIKEITIEEFTRYYLFLEHKADYGIGDLTEEENAKIDAAVKKFMEANSDEALAAMAANEEVVRNYLVLCTEYIKMYNAIAEKVDLTVSEEEAKRKTYSYIYASTETYDEETGASVEMTAEEKQNIYNTFYQVKLDIEGGLEFDAAASAYGYESAAHSYGVQDDGSFNDINSIVDKLEVGETSEIIPVEGGYFLLHLDTLDDKEAAEEAIADIKAQKLNDAFENLHASYEENVVIELNEDLWATATMVQPVAAYVGENE